MDDDAGSLLRLGISKDPADYRYEPPAERKARAAGALAVLFIVAISAPTVLDESDDGWDVVAYVLKALCVGVAATVAQRVLRVVFAWVSRWARPRLRRVTWEPSKSPDDYR